MLEKVRTHLMTVKFEIHLEVSNNFGIRRTNRNGGIEKIGKEKGPRRARSHRQKLIKH